MSLYLRISEHDFCIAKYELREEPIFHFAQHKLRPQASFTINLHEAEETQPLLRNVKGTVNVVVCGPTTLVPLAEFQEEDCAELYGLCFPSDKKVCVFYDIIQAANAVLLFGLDKMICDKLRESFDDVRFISAQTAVLRHFSVKGASQSGKRIFLYKNDAGLDIAVFEENRLLLSNSYPAHTNSDIAYYTFNVARNLGVDLNETPIYVAGDTAERNEVVEELKHFSSEVFAINPAGEFNRHIVTQQEGVPYDLQTLLLEM